MRLAERKREHVSRAHGGSWCAQHVLDMVGCAFLIQEQKSVVQVSEGYAQSHEAKF